MEIDHTFALLMIVFAVFGIAGPMIHFVDRRRRRRIIINFQGRASALGARGDPEHALTACPCVAAIRFRNRKTDAANTPDTG